MIVLHRLPSRQGWRGGRRSGGGERGAGRGRRGAEREGGRGARSNLGLLQGTAACAKADGLRRENAGEGGRSPRESHRESRVLFRVLFGTLVARTPSALSRAGYRYLVDLWHLHFLFYDVFLLYHLYVSPHSSVMFDRYLTRTFVFSKVDNKYISPHRTIALSQYHCFFDTFVFLSWPRLLIIPFFFLRCVTKQCQIVVVVAIACTARLAMSKISYDQNILSIL